MALFYCKLLFFSALWFIFLKIMSCLFASNLKWKWLDFLQKVNLDVHRRGGPSQIWAGQSWRIGIYGNKKKTCSWRSMPGNKKRRLKGEISWLVILHVAFIHPSMRWEKFSLVGRDGRCLKLAKMWYSCLLHHHLSFPTSLTFWGNVCSVF